MQLSLKLITAGLFITAANVGITHAMNKAEGFELKKITTPHLVPQYMPDLTEEEKKAKLQGLNLSLDCAIHNLELYQSSLLTLQFHRDVMTELAHDDLKECEDKARGVNDQKALDEINQQKEEILKKRNKDIADMERWIKNKRQEILEHQETIKDLKYQIKLFQTVKPSHDPSS